MRSPSSPSAKRGGLRWLCGLKGRRALATSVQLLRLWRHLSPGHDAAGASRSRLVPLTIAVRHKRFHIRAVDTVTIHPLRAVAGIIDEDGHQHVRRGLGQCRTCRTSTRRNWGSPSPLHAPVPRQRVVPPLASIDLGGRRQDQLRPLIGTKPLDVHMRRLTHSAAIQALWRIAPATRRAMQSQKLQFDGQPVFGAKPRGWRERR